MSKKNLFIDRNISRVGDFVDDHVTKTKNLKDNIPPFSSVEFSINGACNRRCVFCPRVNEADYPNILNNLDMNAFKNLIKDLVSINYAGRFSFTGFCEPLLTKNLHEYIFEIKSNLPKSIVEIVSNGDVLEKKTGQKVLKNLFGAGLDRIRVSLYDGPHQIPVMKKIRSESKLSEDQFMIRERFLGSEKSHGITISNRAGSINYKTDHFELKALEEPLKQPCYYPFYKVLIDHDGAVLMCSNDWKKEKIYGNILKDSLLTIWSNNKFNDIRKKLSCGNRNYKPCSVCDVNGTLNGQKSFDRWLEYFSKID
mgnify:FL=1